MGEVQISQFASAESAAQQHGENRTVPLPFERVRGRRLPEATGFLGREPVPKPHTQLLGTFHTPDTGGEFRTEQAGVCGLIGESSYCSEPSIDGSRRQLSILKENAVTGHHGLAERQSRLGAVPLNKFIDGVSIAPLGLGRTKAVQDRRLAVIQVRKAEFRLGRFGFGDFPLPSLLIPAASTAAGKEPTPAR
jgi:hypothetical protein